MSYTEATVQLLSPQGTLVENDATRRVPAVDREARRRRSCATSTARWCVIRRFDIEAGNLQRQGQLALWIPSLGQEARAGRIRLRRRGRRTTSSPPTASTSSAASAASTR